MRRSRSNDSSSSVQRKYLKPTPAEDNSPESSGEYLDCTQGSHDASMPCSNVQPPSSNLSAAFDPTPSTSQLCSPNHTVNAEMATDQAVQTEQQTIGLNDDIEQTEVANTMSWDLENTFESKAKFEEFLAGHEEGIWAIKKTQQLKKGEKTMYRCNMMKARGIQCQAQIYCHELNSETIRFYRLNALHNHDDLPQNQSHKVPEGVKELIKEMDDKKMTLKVILNALGKIPDVVVPAKTKVESIIAMHRRNKLKPNIAK